MQTCLDSVQAWSLDQGYAYDLMGEEMLGLVPEWYYQKTLGRASVAMDLAKLLMARKLLHTGWDQVVWMDPGVLVFSPSEFGIDGRDSYAFGAEVRVRRGADGRLLGTRRVHSAFCMFRQGNPVLDFYIHACQRVISRAAVSVAAPLVGTKLLAPLHNLLQFSLKPQVGGLGSLVTRDMLRGQGAALDLYLRTMEAPLRAVVLSESASDEPGDGSGLRTQEVSAICDLLLSPLSERLLVR